MASSKINLTLCRTCVRDNPGTGIFENAEALEAFYKKKLRESALDQVVELNFQNCFAECESFHCLELKRHDAGFRLKKISDPQKTEAVLNWLKQIQQNQRLDLPENLIENLLEPLKT